MNRILIFFLLFLFPLLSFSQDWDYNNPYDNTKKPSDKKNDKIHNLFVRLYSENPDTAFLAFIRLTETKPEKLESYITYFYKNFDDDYNDTLSWYTFRILITTAKFTEYCRKNNINYNLSNNFYSSLITLMNYNLEFKTRYSIENSLIEKLTIDDITPLEYWCLIHEDETCMQYSVGRILDTWYSKNWNSIMESPDQLKLYLKKSMLFDEIPLIGICHNYLIKFGNLNTVSFELLKNLKDKDKDVIKQKDKALQLNTFRLKRNLITTGVWSITKDYQISDLDDQLDLLLNHIEDSIVNDEKLVELLSKISYEQIGTAVKKIENYKSPSGKNKYSFLERDFGFMEYEYYDFRDTLKLNEFMQLYNQYSELELHQYFLKHNNIDYLGSNGEIDFDKAYDILKYDVSDAFIGGIFGLDDNASYSVTKILEYHFDTLLIFSRKYLNSENIYGTDNSQRVTAWMNYLEQNNLLQKSHNEPESFAAKVNDYNIIGLEDRTKIDLKNKSKYLKRLKYVLDEFEKGFPNLLLDYDHPSDSFEIYSLRYSIFGLENAGMYNSEDKLYAYHEKVIDDCYDTTILFREHLEFINEFEKYLDKDWQISTNLKLKKHTWPHSFTAINEKRKIEISLSEGYYVGGQGFVELYIRSLKK